MTKDVLIRRRNRLTFTQLHFQNALHRQTHVRYDDFGSSWSYTPNGVSKQGKLMIFRFGVCASIQGVYMICAGSDSDDNIIAVSCRFNVSLADLACYCRKLALVQTHFG